MSDLLERVRTRLLPAVLTALGVTLLAAGLLSYTVPVAALPSASVPPSAAVAPTPSAAVAPTPSPTPSPLLTLPPLVSTGTTPSPSATAVVTNRVATRIRIAALGIDLPIVAGTADYPLCDVAMYLTDLGQPGQGRATYLYAHARTGMFLPLLRTPGAKQLGMVVELWTSDDQRFLYEITEVRRDQRDLNDAASATTEQLWLQTSEGPKGTPGKTQVIALPLSVEDAPPADAHPTPKPVVCG